MKHFFLFLLGNDYKQAENTLIIIIIIIIIIIDPTLGELSVYLTTKH